MSRKELPIPNHFNENRVEQHWNVDYQQIAETAENWAEEHSINKAKNDDQKVGLFLIDCQNTFCLPGFEMFVAGRTGRGAVEDNIRIIRFIYKNLQNITRIIASMDTHIAVQIFHPIFLVDEDGNHPGPFTPITHDDLKNGKWKINPEILHELDLDKVGDPDEYLKHYAKKLTEAEKYDYMIWPYHSMLGGIGHALAPSLEEALFFHNIARSSQTEFEIKGSNPLTENYSVLSPEITENEKGESIASKNAGLIEKVLTYDKLIIAGQAKSHCVAWTINDLLSEIKERDESLVNKVYLLNDCSSPVVMSDEVDFTEAAEEAYQKFGEAGMNIVNSTDPMDSWPNMDN